MKYDELKPLVFSLNDLAYVDELAVEKNFENPHDHAVYKATEVDEAIAQLKEKLHDVDNKCSSDYVYLEINENYKLDCDILVRKWSDTEWHDPTVDYMGLEVVTNKEAK